MDNTKIIKERPTEKVRGELVTLIQTEEDRKYSLENNVTKFSSIKYKGESITDQKEIEKIIR